LSDHLSGLWVEAGYPSQACPLASLEGCGTGPLAGKDPDLAATLSPSVSHLFASSWCLLHPDIFQVDHPASFNCFHSTKGRKRNATCILIGEGNRGRKKLRHKLKLFFVRCFKHVLPPTSY